MNTITNNAVRNLSIALVALLLVAVSFAIAPKAQASDLFDTPWIDTGYYDTWSPSYDGTTYDTPWTDTGYYDTWSPSYDSYYNDSYMPSYGGGGMGGGSFFGGSGFMGSSGFTRPGNINSNTNINENTCTNGSCNQNINAPTNIVTNYPPQQTYPVYQQPPVYTPPTYYQPPTYQQPIAYNRPAPYVTLSAVPYTGLDLGPWGTAMYWGFLVLWCLIAAYLIAVKKVQNKIAAWFVGGTEPSQNISSQKVLGSASPQPDHFAQKYSASPASTPAFAGIDPFIQSQINRAK